MSPALAAPAPITALGKLRIGVRLSAMIVLLLVCVPGYYAWRALRLANPWPRWFLGAIAMVAGVEVQITGERVRRKAFFLTNTSAGSMSRRWPGRAGRRSSRTMG